MKTPVDTPRVPGDAPGRYLNVGALSRDLAAAAVSVVVLLTSVVSFASLMFPGALAAGAPTAVWAMLVGSGIAGLWVALRSSLPPVSSGIDGATGAIFVLMVGQVAGSVTAAGGSIAAAVQASMLVLAGATAVSGALPFLRWGRRAGGTSCASFRTSWWPGFWRPRAGCCSSAACA